MKEDLSYLDCFVILSETLSFSETATFMAISQPSVSRQIRLLEERLKTPLFVRDKHRVLLTAAGLELRGRIAPLIKEVQQSLHAVRERSEKVEGKVSLGCLQEAGQAIFFQLLLSFQKSYSHLQLHVEYLKEMEIVEKVKKGDLTFGVVTQPVDLESVRTYDLREEKSVMVTRESNQRKMQAFTDEEFIVYREHDRLLAAYIKKHSPGTANSFKPSCIS